ncbi:subclass B1 metallo-beta-lactamase [Pontibacter sp. SGAir0037]|uniref:subclass B1 metallo-beta-lactamase n=1 Tax=Pontibacter sp. SGAir0037 TaxID=2571030 RepID=UPI0010CCB230|nr:subclass B1 metallo-beta-lactamase [Pontibacter sp. SGAir0037]QCR24024.1 subclass B1 metallo-beta-lactamase [Pontibacter sp. SGAir0037]
MLQLLVAFLAIGFLPIQLVLAQEAEVQKIAPQVYRHTSYGMYGNSKVPANGLLIDTSDGVVIIDTAWDNEQTLQLLSWVKNNLKKPVKMCIVTHAHEDRLGGVEVLHQNNVIVFSTAQTAQIALEQHNLKIDSTLPLTLVNIGQQQLEVFYPGAGHAPDNIVVYLPEQKLLFGGCFVKDATAPNLGNLADADVNNWAGAIEKVQQKFPKAKTVIPGHGAIGNSKLLQHTKKLVLEQQQK